MTTTSSAEVGLAGLRAELDLIDATLLDTLKARIGVCVHIADYKREHQVPMMQPHRIGIVQERAARYGAEHGLDGTFLRRLYDLIVEETCRVEDIVIDSTPPDRQPTPDSTS